jgi:hypothetical protein
VVLYKFTRTCWALLLHVRSNSTPKEIQQLMKAISDIAKYPTLPGSKLSFHNSSSLDARCYMVSPFTLLYDVDDQGRATFTAIWRTTS